MKLHIFAILTSALTWQYAPRPAKTPRSARRSGISSVGQKPTCLLEDGFPDREQSFRASAPSPPRDNQAVPRLESQIGAFDAPGRLEQIRVLAAGIEALRPGEFATVQDLLSDAARKDNTMQDVFASLTLSPARGRRPQDVFDLS